MPEAAQIGLFVHLVAVLALGAGIGVSIVTLLMMRGAATVQELRFWGGLGKLMSKYQVMPGIALVLLLSGGYLVNELSEEWSEGWIGLSTLGLIAAVAVGLFVVTPRMKAIGMAAAPAPDGPVPSNIAAQVREPLILGAALGNSMTALAIIWNMTIQPGLAGAALAIVLLVGIGWAAAFSPLFRE